MKQLFQHILLIVCITTLLFGCSNSPGDEIVIAIPDGPSVISMMRIIDQPPVIDGKQVKVMVQSEPLQIQAMMVQNKLDFAMLPTVMAANLYNKNVNYRLLAIPVWGTLYVVTNDSTIHDTSDLNDLTIHIFGQGATADVLFRHYMKSKQLRNIHIDYSFNTNQEVALALLNRTISTAIVSEPLVSMLISRDSKLKIISELTVETNQNHLQKNMFAQTALLVRSDFLEKHPEYVRKMVSHVEASCMYTMLRPEKIASLMVEYKFADDIATAMRSIPLCNIDFVKASAIREEIGRYLNIFYTFDPASIGGKLPDEAFIVDEE